MRGSAMKYLSMVGIALIASVFFYLGMEHTQSKWNAEKLAESEHEAKVSEKQDQVYRQVITQYIARVKTVQTQGKTITKQVPIYVTLQNDAQCTINNGFVRVWNAANSGLQIPDTASGTDGASSGIRLSDIGRQHIIESTYTRREDEKLISLQKWVKAVEIIDGN